MLENFSFHQISILFTTSIERVSKIFNKRIHRFCGQFTRTILQLYFHRFRRARKCFITLGIETIPELIITICLVYTRCASGITQVMLIATRYQILLTNSCQFFVYRAKFPRSTTIRQRSNKQLLEKRIKFKYSFLRVIVVVVVLTASILLI